MRTLRGLSLILAVALLCGTAPAQEPAGAPWYLNFSHGPLEAVTIPYRDGSARTFYLMAFQVWNPTSVEARLSLQLEATVHSGTGRSAKHISLPAEEAEEWVRRMGRSPELKNVQQINRHGAADSKSPGRLPAGERLKGIAVFGTFDREWDTATITVSGLEPRALRCRIRKYSNGEFTLPQRGYDARNEAVRANAPDGDQGEEIYAIVSHDIVWSMTYRRLGDEFAPHLDEIVLEGEGWRLARDSEPKIVLELQPTFGG